MPQGASAPVASGDYIGTSAAGGLDLPYRYFIEVPPGLGRLVVGLFDPDIGTGGAAEADANRDRDRGDGYSSASTYVLIDPSGRLAASQTSATLSASDNAWATLLDTNAPPASPAPTLLSHQFATATAATTLTVNIPNGTAGDMLIATIALTRDNGNPNPATPGGWTLLNEGDCPTGGGDTSCRLETFYRVAVAGDTSVSYSWATSEKAIGSVLRYTPVNGAPTISTPGTGNSAAPTANSVVTGAANSRVIRVMAASSNVLAGDPYPAGTQGQFDIQLGGGGDDLASAAADAAQAVAGGSGTAAFALSSGQNWRTLSIALAPATTSFALTAGHWELLIHSVGGGNDLNAIGIRANDGNAGAGGTELPVYYDSHSQIGTNDTAGAPSTRNYDLYPWVTAGCTFRESDFDFDVGNGTGGGPAGAEYGRIELVRPDSTTLNPPTFPSPAVLHQALASSTLSGDNVWNTDAISGWTTDSDAVHYGIWRADAQISEYSGPNSNYANIYFTNFESAGGAPTANPSANAFRVYLPTDANGAPAKPYLEQFARWLSGPNPPNVGQTTRMVITVRLVNPAAQAITFSTPNNVVTVPLSGNAALDYVAGSAAASSGTIVSQPAGGAASGNVVWNPGTLAAGSVQVVTFLVDVTPTVALARIPLVQAPDILPSLLGTRAQYVDETGNTTQARATYRLGPICEVAVTEDALTRAVVTGLETRATRDGVVVRWETATEDGTVGFRLYRQQAGEWKQVSDLVRSDPRAVGGASYRVLDRDADPAAESTYGLVEVDRRGETRAYGPFVARPRRGGETLASAFEVRPFSPPAREIERLEAAAREAHRSELTSAARTLPFRGGRSLAQPLRIRVRDSGLYALTSTAIAAAAGIAEPSVRAQIQAGQLRLETQGTAVATLAAADGSALYFYGEARDSQYGLDNVYWLRNGAALTMGQTKVGGLSFDGATSSLERLRVEQDLFEVTVLPIAPEDDYWFWNGMEAGTPGADVRDYAVTLPGATSAGPDGSLEVRLRGASSTGVAGEHHVEVRFAGTLLGVASFQGLAEEVASFPLPAVLLGSASPAIELRALLQPGVSYSGLFVDGFDVVYPRRHNAELDRIELETQTTTASVTGFSAGDALVFDLADRKRPAVAIGSQVRNGLEGWSVGFRAQPDRRYLVTRLAAARTPLAIETDTASDLRNAAGAEYVVVAPPSLTAGAQQLAALRAGQGLSTLVVSLQDVDDEFGAGLPAPENLRAFLAWAWEHWSIPPRYAVLVGEGTYDYRDLLGLGGNLIPALMVAEGGALAASDARYGDVDGDGLAEIAVGRIPVLTQGELANYIARVVEVESAPANAAWRRSAVVASDDADFGTADFKDQSEAAASRLPAGLEIAPIHLSLLSVADARLQLLGHLQAGASLFLFHGHGGLDRLADESLLTAADAPSIANAGREPVLAALTCAINRFEVPGFPALGEDLVRAADGAALGVWAPSGLSQGGESPSLGEHFAAAAFRAPDGRLGDLLLETGQRYVAAGGQASMLSIYHLMGDPALRLIAPVVDSPAGGTPAPTE